MPSFDIRPYGDDDEPAVLALLARSLGKDVDDRYRAFFRWKHLANPVGRSYMWVAEASGSVVGFRTFMRWRFRDASGLPIEAVRAVDTATDPDHRGGGVFRALTEHGLRELHAAGVAFVFNTPNDQSRPGYLKMGWSVVGRAEVQLRPRSPASLVRLAGARTAAGLWSEPTDVGIPARDLLDQPGLNALLERCGSPGEALAVDRTAAFLRWRYAGFDGVASRGILVGESIEDGVVLVRLRARGSAIECTVGDVLVAPSARRAATRAVRRTLRATRADYALAGSRARARLPGFVATTRLGPVVTYRPTGAAPGDPPRFALALGDLELF